MGSLVMYINLSVERIIAMELRKKLISIAMSTVMLASVSITAVSAQAPIKIEKDIDIISYNQNLYETIYNKCILEKNDVLIDDMSIYSYLLKHLNLIDISNNIVSISEFLFNDLSADEIILLNDFICRMNNLLELRAITIDDNLKISMPEIVIAESKLQPYAMSINLMSDCRTHAIELKRVYDNAILIGGYGVVCGYFTARVKSGGEWDYKAYLGYSNLYYETELGATMTGETIGNFHYGYVGSAVFAPTVLKTAAGFAQILDGTSDLSFWNSYFDDPKDQADIQWGINVYNQEH